MCEAAWPPFWYDRDPLAHSTLRAAFSEGALIATAPAGSPAGSRDASRLAALRTTLETGGVAETMNEFTQVTQKARALSRDVDNAIAAAGEIRAAVR